MICCDGLATSGRGIADVENAEALLTEMTFLFDRLEFSDFVKAVFAPEIVKLFPLK